MSVNPYTLVGTHAGGGRLSPRRGVAAAAHRAALGAGRSAAHQVGVAWGGGASARPRSHRHAPGVDDPRWPGRWPALLHHWRRNPDGWVGVITAAVPGPEGQIVITTEALAAHLQA